MRKTGPLRTFARNLEVVFIGGGWTSPVVLLVGLMTVAFGVQILTGASFLHLFALGGGVGGEVEPWQLFTFVLVNDLRLPVGLGQLALNLVILGIVAGDVGQRLGSRRFGVYTLVSILGAAIGAVAFRLDQPVYGAIGPVAAVVLAFGILNPDRRIYGRIPARGYAALLLGMLTACHFFLFPVGTSPGIDPWGFLFQAGGALGAGYLFFALRPFVRRRNLVRSMFRQLRSMQQDDIDHDRVDQLLEKISSDGIDRLSRDERRFLDRASQRLQETRDRTRRERLRRVRSREE